MKNTKKISILLLTFMLATIFAMPVFATDMPLVNDEAGLFTSDELENLQARAQEVSDTWEQDVAILTVNSVPSDKTAMTYAEEYIVEYNFGYGDTESVILFFIDMGERDWRIVTSGDSIYTFTDYGQEVIADQMLSYLSDGDYYEAFSAYYNAAESYLEQDATGDAYDSHNMSGSSYDYDTYNSGFDLERLGIGLIIGVIGAGALCAVFYFQLRSVAPAHNANNYISRKLDLSIRKDRYLYSNTTKTEIPKSNGGGGGSSTHTGAGGRTFGGSGGKF